MLGFLDAGNPLPLEHLFVPLVQNAREELCRQVDAALYGLLTPEAHSGWERYLLARLCAAGSKAAQSRFEGFKAARQAFTLDRPRAAREPNFLYCEFIGGQPEDRLQKLFGEFPILAHLCKTLVKNWLSAVAEFVNRLEVDRHGLGLHFKTEDHVCPVVYIQAGLSDPHQGGRSVVRVLFGSGATLIYKPRCIQAEAHFAALLDQCNTLNIPHRLRAARCWDRGEYGWMEHIAPRPCLILDEVRAFYWRAGALLGLIYLARGVDFHRENLVAAGEFPVLVDLEALWHCQNAVENPPTSVLHTVIHTGFLPHGAPESNGSYEWGALARRMCIMRQASIWAHVNSDHMTLVTQQSEVKSRSHLPACAGVPYLASEYVPAIQAGFRWIGDRLLGSDHGRETWAAWLQSLIKIVRRVIRHPTARYLAALDQSTLPQFLRGKHEFLQSLAGFLHTGKPEFAAELLALKQLDIPRFESVGSGNDTLGDSNAWIPTIEEYLAQSALITQSLANAA